MKKLKNYLLFIFVIFTLCFSIFNANLFLNNNVVFAVEDASEEPTDNSQSNALIKITKLNEIANADGKYSLTKNDYTLESSSLPLDTFSGTLNGNGSKIIIKAGVPMFKKLSGATIYNLTFVVEPDKDSNVIEPIEVILENKTSYGVLADVIENSTVYGIKIENVEIKLNGESSQSISTLNIGLLAGQVASSNINQIYVNNCSFNTPDKSTNTNGNTEPNKKSTEIDKEKELKSDFNLGFLVGKIDSGTRLQNNLVKNSSLNIGIGESESVNFNIGGLVGYCVSSYKISNNIVDFSNSNTKVAFDRLNKYLNFGYLIGKTETNQVSIYNNVINVATNNNAFDIKGSESNILVGLCLGNMNSPLEKDSIYGIMSTLNEAFVGNYTKEQILSNYEGLNVITESEIISKIKNETDCWNIIETWDFKNIWITKDETTPLLQYFQTYSVTFSSQDSVKTLGIDNLPTDADGDVIESKFDIEKTNEILYGQSITLTTNVTSTKNFNKFFEIVGLYLNGTRIYHIENGADEGYEITHKIEENGSTTFTISNFKAINSGTYAVELKQKEFKLKINVYELTINNKPFTPGKIKSTDGAKALKNGEVITMKYGSRYSYETCEVDSDYSKEADWFLNYTTETSEHTDNSSSTDSNDTTEKAFDKDKYTPNFTSKNKLTWVFNENCILFKSSNNMSSSNDTTSSEKEKIWFEIDEYAEEKIFSINVVFTRNVKDIVIKFKYDDEEEITSKIANVKIDDSDSTIEFKDGCFYTKKRYGDHTISLSGLMTDYNFDGWYYESGTRLSGVMGDEFGASFKLSSQADDSGEIVLCAVFTKNAKVNSHNLLWLWLTLGGVGLAGVVTIIVLIVKKKRAGGSGYRKYMY